MLDDKKEKKVTAANSEVKDDNKNNSSQKNMEENSIESLQKQDKIEQDITSLHIKDKDPDINQNGSEANVNGCATSYSLSKFNDDSIMEGYGTDDDTNAEIDLERRKHFIEKNVDKTKERGEEVMQEEEEEDDTQVPSNISINDSLIKDNSKKQGNIILTGGTYILKLVKMNNYLLICR